MRDSDSYRTTATGLTAKSLEGLLARLSPDREIAAAEYERLRARLVNYFRLRGLSDPFAAADITLDRVAVRALDGVVDDVHKFCFGVARLITLEQLRMEERRRISHEQFMKADGQPGDEEEFYARLRRCLEVLTPPDRALLEEYYRQGPEGGRKDRREGLAEREGMTLSNLRLRVHRLRNTLRECLRAKT